jgi:ABC-2 type transport system ATP-binding protein
VTNALETRNLGRRYGSMWALRDCTLQLPRGAVAALVGPNGAGKSTLLHLAVGILQATEGSVSILGESMRGQHPEMLARIGFVAQDAPLYRNFSVADMLRFGEHLNPRWDNATATRRLARLNIPLDRQCGRLSGGQQAQVALAMAAAKRPEVLFLDEPLASLDPLARRDFLEVLMETVADGEVTVVLSSHLIADLERVCDHLIVLTGGRTALAGTTEDLVADHHRLVGPRSETNGLAHTHDIIEERSTDRQTTVLVRGGQAVLDPRWEVSDVGLEDLVLAYLRRPDADRGYVAPTVVARESA